MWEGRSEHAWGQTSLIAYILAEVNRDHKKRPQPFSPADFNPHAKGGRRRPPAPSNGGGSGIKVTPQILKQLFIDQKN